MRIFRTMPFLLIAFFVAVPVFASGTDSGFVSISGFPAFSQASGVNGLSAFINILYTYLIGIAAVLAIVEIIWGGFLWMGSGASVTSKSAGRKKIELAITGLVLVLSPVVIFSIINPQILSLNLGSSSLAPHATKQQSVSKPVCKTCGLSVPDQDTNSCKTVFSGPYLGKAVCPSTSAAQDYSCKYNLQPEITPCQKEDTSGNCLDTNVTVYCSGKNTIFEFYSYYHGVIGVVGLDAWVIPSEASVENTFINSCVSAGGTVDYSLTAGALILSASHIYQAIDTCPQGSGVVIDNSKGSGVVCYKKKLTCEAP